VKLWKFKFVTKGGIVVLTPSVLKLAIYCGTVNHKLSYTIW